jgi:hypothetical protein
VRGQDSEVEELRSEDGVGKTNDPEDGVGERRSLQASIKLCVAQAGTLNLTPEKHCVNLDDITDGMSWSGFVKPEEVSVR